MQDFFALLGLACRFELDEAALEKRYFALQKQYHPDKQTDPVRRAAALQYSADLNDAYRTLGHPLTRAQHLLALSGIAVNTEKDSVPPSIELLAEAMEWRERLAEAEGEAAVGKLKREADALYEENLKDLTAAFDAGNEATAAQLTLRLGYLVKWRGEVQRQYTFLQSRAG